MKMLRTLSRLLVGIVFIFSGFVKAVDPLGSTYKFGDYFTAFNIGFLESFALPLAILLSSIELVLGISLLLGYRMRFTSWVVLLFMSFFTILTFILALTNPVSDCGCFGDALILTNWETFWKNIVIMAVTIIVFISRDKYQLVREPVKEWIVIAGFFVLVVLLSLYCYRNLPLLDFRPYGVGTYIPDGMVIPEGAPQSEFETRLYYRNSETGEEKEFTMENFPKDTLRWEFIDAVSKQVSEGYEPPIHDFNIMAPDGSVITDEIISWQGYTFFLVSYNALEADKEALKRANKYFQLSQAVEDIRFFAVSASLREDLDSIRLLTGLEYDFSQADEITLKTIVRSNPGLLLIKNGTIMDKWGHRNFPDHSDFQAYSDIFANFPFCKGCDMNVINQPPLGSRPDEYESLLYYRNANSDSIYEFTMDNFPRDSDEWVFENSVTRMTREGFRNPLSSLEISSVYGMDFKDIALYNDANSLLIFLQDPGKLSEDQFKALNKFGGMAMEYLPGRMEVFAVTSLSDREILDFTNENISPYEYYIGDPDQVRKIAGDEVRLVLLNNGKVLYNWSGDVIPDPEVLAEIEEVSLRHPETVLTPGILENMRSAAEKRIVYIFLLSFLVITLVLRVYFNLKEPDA
ncbi:MAG: BT_3928 family protein [Bacteroidales bacterium]